ncbi:MAG: tRNA-binding protein [Methanobacterium sp.]|uniref:tRNA-binding protein n=1 Tax=Methanobacterium sp. TaxID=2164 RepID=UPI003D6576E6|nr:tRNA-binding protein [Methanobacterium sp.]
MWDTSKDYRLKAAEKSVDLFLRTLEGANLKGRWNKKQVIQNARDMIPEIQSLYYSYVEPAELAKMPQIVSIKEKANHIIENLGGNDWYKHFLELVSKDEKSKLEEAVAKIRFFLNIILNIDKRLALGPIDDPIVAIDIHVGDIVSVGGHPAADNLLVCNVNIKERAITVVTNDLDVKESNKVAVAMLPPTSFMGITSEGMFLGAGEGVLKDVQGETGGMPKGFPLEALNEARNFVETFLK